MQELYDDAPEFASPDCVTVAQTCLSRDGTHRLLTKQLFGDGRPPVAYDSAKFFNLYEVQVWDLSDLYRLSERLLARPRCCLHRTAIRDPERTRRVRRLAYDDLEKGDAATLVSQPMRWFALDVDGHGKCSGDLGRDARAVLQALGWGEVEAFAVASSSYGIKPGVHCRIFLWNQERVSNRDLLAVLKGNQVGVDLALFSNPVQPIYSAAPRFVGMADPLGAGGRIRWLPGRKMFTEVRHVGGRETGVEAEYTVRQGRTFAKLAYQRIAELRPMTRHDGLLKESIWLGKLVEQELIDEDEVISMVELMCQEWDGPRDKAKDRTTLLDGLKRGKLAQQRGRL